MTRQGGNKSGTVTASILTYNAMRSLPDVIEGLERQSVAPDRVLIVDNSSTDGTTDYIEQLPGTYEKLLLEENMGVGAGHNAGWRRVLEDSESDYIWTLENDSIPPENCLELLINRARKLEEAGTPFGAVTPRQVSPGTEQVDRKADLPQPRKTMTFNGSLIKTEAIRSVGPIREDFFMDQEDREYAQRMNSAGFTIYRDPEATIVHLGKGSNRPGPPTVLRTYYRVRNETFTRKSLSGESMATVKSLVRAVGGIGRTVLSEDEKTRRIQARWTGTIDGLRGDLGKKHYSFLDGGR